MLFAESTYMEKIAKKTVMQPAIRKNGHNGKGQVAGADTGKETVKTGVSNEEWMEGNPILELNPLPIVVLDSKYRLIALNSAYAELMQQSREKLLAMDAMDYKIRFISGDRTEKTFQEKKVSRAELEITFADKTHKTVIQWGVPIPHASGNVETAFFVFTDITKQREEEVEIAKQMEKVRTLQRRSETIVQLNPLPILLVDTTFKILVSNEAFEKMSGIPHQQLLTMSARDFKVSEQKGEGLKQVIQQKKRSYGEVTVDLPSGVHILEQWGIPITNEAGDLSNLLIVYKDVTDLRKKEGEIQGAFAELTEFKQRASSIIQQNPFAMLVWDASLKIIETNEAFLQLSGWSRDKTLTSTINDFKFLGKSGEGFDVAIKQKRSAMGEATIEFPTGVRILERYTIPFLTAKGEVGSLLTVYNDITDKRAKDQEVARLMEESRERAELLGQSAREVEHAVNALAKGDLCATAKCGDNDPLQKVKSDYNASIAAIRMLLEEVLHSVRQVETTTQDVSKATGEIAKATTQVATSTQMSSEYAGKQLEQIEGVGKEVSDLSASVEEIASTSHTVMERAQNVAKEGNQAKELGNQANAKMKAVEKIAKQSVEEITRLNDQMREIAKIVKLITDIANQTNLLALNAAIEAARAGEHGRGFAVVAGEVRNLAGESKKATAHIEEVITAITANSARTATSMQTAYGEITEGIGGVQNTIEVLNRIIADVETVANGVTEISRATEEQANATNRVMERMEQTTHLTKENMKQIEEMAALAEEVSASTEEVGSGAQELSSMAVRLKGMMDQFRLN